MIQLLGFDSDPHCIIWWQKNGVAQSKTVCYSEVAEVQMLERLNTTGDFYSKYDKAVVTRHDDTVMEHFKILKRGA